MRIEVLGPLHVVVDERHLSPRDFRGAKPKQILQVLAVERGHTVPKERLADLLWGDAVPRNHMATLESYISVLRQTLSPGSGPRQSVVLTERGGYRLDVDEVELDLDEFDRTVEEAVGAHPLAALEALKRALALFRGDVLEDEPYADWARSTRSTYTQRRVQVLIDAGRLSLLTGEAAAALALAEQAVALNPLAEPAYQVVMTAAYSLWRQDEALAAFDRCRRLLADELGTDPLDETVALHLSILRHEDIAQLLPAVDPAPSTPVPDRLPLLDRDMELQQLRAAADRAAAGRFTVALVTGAPGLGKTRLVEALAEQLDMPVASNRCSDLERGFPFLALSLALRPLLADAAHEGLPGLDDLLERAANAQAIDEFARLRVMESLAAALPKQPACVVVLDDVQWADAETVTTLGYLQRRCPEAKVLVVLTSDGVAFPSQPLRAVRPDVRIDLRELPRSAVERLAGPDLYAAAGGNPSYIAGWLEARVRGLAEPFTPELAERVVLACWDLGPQVFRLLCAAAALEDRTFSAELLAYVLGAGAPDVTGQVDLLYERGLLDVEDRFFTFRSPAVRSILAGTISPVRRSLLHQAAARFAGTAPARRATDRRPPVDDLAPRRRASDQWGSEADTPR